MGKFIQNTKCWQKSNFWWRRMQINFTKMQSRVIKFEWDMCNLKFIQEKSNFYPNWHLLQNKKNVKFWHHLQHHIYMHFSFVKVIWYSFRQSRSFYDYFVTTVNLVVLSQNAYRIRDLEAELMREVCHDVEIEPELLPIDGDENISEHRRGWMCHV